MTFDELKQAANVHIARILAAKVCEETVGVSTDGVQSGELVTLLAPSRIGIRGSASDARWLVLARTAAFEPQEIQLARDFARELFLIHRSVSVEFRNEVLTFLSERAITRHLGNFPALRSILNQFNRWNLHSYEGSAISTAFGIDPSAKGGTADLETYFAQPFSPVLGNGFDTIVVCDGEGRMIGVEQLEPPAGGVPQAPYRFAALANWCTGRRIALVLNHRGDQVIFRNRRMVCLKLWGRWLYNTYEMYVDQISPTRTRELREAIVETCMDTSFARTGGCLVVVRESAMADVAQMVSENDRLDCDAPATPKAEILQLLTRKRFQDLDRRLRQELLAIDGATVLTEDGDILAVGAILSVPSGSHGGGRRSAAVRGSELGLGIKLSEDGGISIFRDGRLAFNDD